MVDFVTKGELLKAAGRLLCPAGWSGGLAARLGVNPRRLRRMATGEEETPEGLLADTKEALETHRSAVDALLTEFQDVLHQS